MKKLSRNTYLLIAIASIIIGLFVSIEKNQIDGMTDVNLWFIPFSIISILSIIKYTETHK